MGLMQSKVQGIFTVQLKDANSNIKFESTFENFIPDFGLYQMCHNENWDTYGNFTELLKYVRLGTGTAAPQPTDLSLTGASSTNAGTTHSAGVVDGETPYKWVKRQFQINPGVATGTWSELGIFHNTGGAPISRTLIKDGGGSPISITKLSTDYLYIIYEFRQYFPTIDYVSSFPMDGNTYNYTVRRLRANAASTGDWKKYSLLDHVLLIDGSKCVQHGSVGRPNFGCAST